MARFQIAFLCDFSSDVFVGPRDYAAALEPAKAKGHEQRERMTAGFGAVGFYVRDLNEYGRVVAIERFDADWRKCPTCGAALVRRIATFDGALFECMTHGRFGVSGPAELRGFWKQERGIQEDAIQRAREDASPAEGGFPIVMPDHLSGSPA